MTRYRPWTVGGFRRFGNNIPAVFGKFALTGRTSGAIGIVKLTVFVQDDPFLLPVPYSRAMYTGPDGNDAHRQFFEEQ